MLKDMAEKVDEFQRELIELPYHVGLLPEQRMRFRAGHLQEELDEINDAYKGLNADGVVDGLIDLIYIAIGAILEMGVPADESFGLVHSANMAKERGVTKRGEAFDAVKPKGWQPPDHQPLIDRMKMLAQVSPVFVELTKMRLAKGANYNRGSVKRSDHFPLGHVSYFTMVWIKSIRLRSLVESTMGSDDLNLAKTNGLIDRELNDLINYACFWAEHNRGISQEDKK